MTNSVQQLHSEVERIHQRLLSYQLAGKRLFASSSFQTHSIPLLHIIAAFDRSIPIYFLDTGFHFPETRLFRDQVSNLLGLHLKILTSPVPKAAQKDGKGNFLFTSDPDRCCYLNKVLPLEPVLKSNDVWISGVRKDQTQYREGLASEEPGAHDTLRYHPILDWDARMIWSYREQHQLPEHPLEQAGYLSIGCIPCTRKFIESSGDRAGRWAGMTKEECGIHTEFVAK